MDFMSPAELSNASYVICPKYSPAIKNIFKSFILAPERSRTYGEGTQQKARKTDFLAMSNQFCGFGFMHLLEFLWPTFIASAGMRDRERWGKLVYEY